MGRSAPPTHESRGWCLTCTKMARSVLWTPTEYTSEYESPKWEARRLYHCWLGRHGISWAATAATSHDPGAGSHAASAVGVSGRAWMPCMLKVARPDSNFFIKCR